ncbi:MAG TPA: gene transfer agent family protein [Kaistiaceae bacterium]|nr:gene transfer agent family protein [Kaistiaceae bacterium]
MANPRRGEVEAVIDGRPTTLCLTLGALAELEAAFGAGDLVELAGRFETGRLAAGDLVKVIAAGLRGAGHEVTATEVATMRIDGGAAGAARLVAELLAATFGSPGEAAANPR